MHRATAGERLAGIYARVVVLLRHVVPLAWIVAAIAAWALLPGLGSSTTAPLGDIVPTDAKAVLAQEHALRLFGSTLGTDTAIVERNPRGFSRRELASAAELARSVRDRPSPPGLAGVRAAVPVPNVRIPGVRWREQGTTVVTYLFLDPSLNLEERDRLAHRYAAAAARDPGTTVGVTGAGPARLEQFQSIDHALPLVTAATVLVILGIVALYFRSLGAPLVTLLTGGIAYAVAVRVLGWLGERAGVTAPSEIEPVLVVLLLGLVTDYTVFFMAEARRRLLAGDERVVAARRATARIAPIVFTAGVIVAAGAACLLAGKMEFFRVFGPGLALSALTVTLVCVTFVPAVLGLLGPRLFGRRVRRAGRFVRAEDEPASAEPAPGNAPGWRRRLRLRLAGPLGGIRAARSHARAEGGRVVPALIARMLATRPVAIVLALVVVAALLVAAAGGTQARLGVSFIPSLPAGSEAARAAAAARTGMGPGVLAPTEILVEQPGIGTRPAVLARAQRTLARQPGVAGVVGPVQPAGTPLEAQAVTRDGAAARFAVLLRSEPTGADAIADLNRLRDRMPALLRQAGAAPGARVSYAGETALAAETVGSMKTDLKRVALATLLVVFLLLAIFLRALVAPLVLLAASVLAFAASFGLVTTILGLTGSGPELIYYVPLVGGVLLVGLGSDYNVFIAGRIREEATRRRPREAIAVAAPSASRAITVAGITLAATFALLAIVPLRPFRELALLLAIGVLVDALVVRPLLIPSLVTVLGRRAWWPGRPQRPASEDAFVGEVAERAGTSLAHARRLSEATLATLAERLPARESCEVARQLPESLGAPLRDCPDRSEPFGFEEFVARVAARARSDRDGAAQDARAVVQTLVEALPATELDYMRAALSRDYAWLFGDSPSRPSEPSRSVAAMAAPLTGSEK